MEWHSMDWRNKSDFRRRSGMVRAYRTAGELDLTEICPTICFISFFGCGKKSSRSGYFFI